MIKISARHESGLGGVFSGSLLLHILLLLIASRLSLLTGPLATAQIIYEVDLLNLPVAAPQAGEPSAAPQATTVPSPPVSHDSMSLPTPKSAVKLTTKPVPAPSPNQDSEAFSRRMADLERKAEARHEANAIEQLRSKASKGQAGMPDGSGTESGSDYTSYLHSRLTDAFKTTITYQSKDPEVAVRLVIDGKGRIVASRIERSSGDKLFEDAALRAISKAARLLVPPPNGSSFEHGFVFRPQGVGK
jgi:colicin import membrane protein